MEPQRRRKSSPYTSLNAALNVDTTPPVSPFQSGAAYNYDIGKAVSTTDVNGNTTNYAYNDTLGRLTGLTQPDGGSTNIV